MKYNDKACSNPLIILPWTCCHQRTDNVIGRIAILLTLTKGRICLWLISLHVGHNSLDFYSGMSSSKRIWKSQIRDTLYWVLYIWAAFKLKAEGVNLPFPAVPIWTVHCCKRIATKIPELVWQAYLRSLTATFIRSLPFSTSTLSGGKVDLTDSLLKPACTKDFAPGSE